MRKKKANIFFSKSKLAIAKDVVETSLNGKIFGYSDGVGRGATFGFEIPVEVFGRMDVVEHSAFASVGKGPLRRSANAPKKKASNARSLRILCVDDSKILLQVVAKQVSKVCTEAQRECEIVTCPSALQAIPVLDEAYSMVGKKNG